MQESIIQARELTKHFFYKGNLIGRGSGWVHAVDQVNLDVVKRETLGLVGESGCGKTTLARVLLKLIEPDSGSIKFNGADITKVSKSRMKEIRRNMQIVFQDPFGALDPRQRIIDSVAEPLKNFSKLSPQDTKQTVLRLLERVGLTSDHLYRLPHEFSGGQRQRICIARALILEPQLLVLDEPSSSLDVSVQAQILNLLKDLQRELGLTYLFISHDLSVISHISSRVAVMYIGKIVEIGPANQVFHKPLHPYTQALFAAIPVPDVSVPWRDLNIRESVDVPSAVNPPSGCRFRTRCTFAQKKCETEPPLIEVESGRFVACHFWDGLQTTKRS